VLVDKASPQAAWIEINTATPTASMPIESFYPENVAYDSAEGIGRYYPGTNGSGGAALRGGSWADGAYAGPFALGLNSSPSSSHPSRGFRCAFAPGGSP
jgi:hypothetical protein